MSGNPTSNVVPMPHVQAPAINPAQAPMPFPMWGGGGTLPWGPGCCPPGGMDALLKCYCDVQAATAFICSVMVQCVQTNPAVVQAIIAAIEASGSTLPLIGVTNGSDAQPGQVGEFVQLTASIAYPATPASTVSGTYGVLNPGDWDCWMYGLTTTVVGDLSQNLNPQPPGFNSDMQMRVEMPDAAGFGYLPPTLARASLSVPTLIAVSIGTNFTASAGNAGVFEGVFCARRRR